MKCRKLLRCVFLLFTSFVYDVFYLKMYLLLLKKLLIVLNFCINLRWQKISHFLNLVITIFTHRTGDKMLVDVIIKGYTFQCYLGCVLIYVPIGQVTKCLFDYHVVCSQQGDVFHLSASSPNMTFRIASWCRCRRPTDQ